MAVVHQLDFDLPDLVLGPGVDLAAVGGMLRIAAVVE